MSVGERISSLRKEKNISQYQLASIMGVSRQAVSKWENDQSSPDTLNLIRLADILDTQVEYLATGKTGSPSPSKSIEKIVEVEKTVEVERVIERKVSVEKPVYIEKVIEVEKPVIRRVIRNKIIRNPVEYAVFGIICFIIGLIVGILL